MVTYANVTKGYGVKYFSIGNEPDIYGDATGSTKGIPLYTPLSYCATAQAFVAMMKWVDPTIKSWDRICRGNTSPPQTGSPRSCRIAARCSTS